MELDVLSIKTPVRMIPCPHRLHHHTSWTGGILMGKMMMVLDVLKALKLLAGWHGCILANWCHLLLTLAANWPSDVWWLANQLLITNADWQCQLLLNLAAYWPTDQEHLRSIKNWHRSIWGVQKQGQLTEIKQCIASNRRPTTHVVLVFEDSKI